MFVPPRNALRATFLLVIIFIASLYLACASSKNPNVRDTSSRRQLTDDSGKSVALPTHVNRVISLAPNLTEIVFAVGGGADLVGRTSYCDFPAEARSISEIGDTLHPSLEKIIALKPQIVLVSTASQLEVFARQLQEHDIAVFVTDPHDLEGVFGSIDKIGDILGQGQQAKQLVDSLRQRVALVEQKTKTRTPVKVFYQLSAEPLYTAGRDAFVNDLVRRAGGVSVTADVPGAWPKYSAEAALATKPEAIILPTGGSMGDHNSTVADALKRSPAVVQGRVFKINDDHLVRPGPRAVDGLEAIARALHPEAFKE